MRVNADFDLVEGESFPIAIQHLESVKKEGLFGFDTETNKDGSIRFIQIYSPISNKTFIFNGDDPQIKGLAGIWETFNVVGHNLQFDLSACLRQYGNYPNPAADTFLIACSLQEEQKGLKALCSQFFGFPVTDWETLFGDYDYSNMDSDKWHYVANDPYYACLLFEHYRQAGAYRFVKKAHEIDIKAMILYMEASVYGLQVDQGRFSQYLEQYTAQVNDLQDRLNAYAGWEVRTGSTKDLKRLLFEQMGLPTPPITTDKGEVSVSKEALSYVPDKDGIITLITQVKESKAILAAMNSI